MSSASSLFNLLEFALIDGVYALNVLSHHPILPDYLWCCWGSLWLQFSLLARKIIWVHHLFCLLPFPFSYPSLCPACILCCSFMRLLLWYEVLQRKDKEACSCSAVRMAVKDIRNKGKLELHEDLPDWSHPLFHKLEYKRGENCCKSSVIWLSLEGLLPSV